MSTPTLYHVIRYDDAPAGIAFLEAIGFTRVAVYADPEDPSIVQHAQLNWRGTGGIMLGSQRGEGKVETAQAACYLVVDSDDDVDAAYRRALDAGATSVEEPNAPDYGGRGCTVADAEGNTWSIGSYRGEEPPER